MNRRRLLKLILPLVAVIAAAGVALAFYTSTGSGSATATVGTFDAAVVSAPSTASSSPTISIDTAATVPDDSADDGEITYTVQRRPHGTGSFADVASGTCSGSLPSTTTSCDDSSAAPSATYDYRVIASWRSWTATSNTAGPVALAPDAPTAVSVANGGGFINNSTKGGVNVDVTVPSSSAATDTVTVTLDDGSATATGSASSVDGGGVVHVTGIDASSLGDGSITVSAISSNGGADSSSASTSATKDTQAPNAPTSVAVVSPSGVVNNSTKSNASVDVVVPAGSSTGDTISLSVSDGTPAHTVTATHAAPGSGGGTVHFTGLDLSGLDDGSISLSATSTDTAGNASSAATGSATKDTQAPNSPTSVAVVSPSGVVNNSTKSNASVDVVVPAGSSTSDTINLSVSDGTPAHTVTATQAAPGSGGGTVHFTGLDLSGLDDGSISLSATSSDTAGNASSAATGSATKDTQAPNAPTSVAVINPSGYVNNSTKSSASVDVVVPAGSSASDTINLSVSDGTPAHTVTATHAAPGSGGGTVHFTGLDLSGLDDGSISLSATSSDTAGNASSAATGSATKDTSAPDAPTAASVVSGGGFINAATQTSVNVDVTAPATALSTDTITVTLDDGNGHTATGTAPSTTGGGTIHVLGIDAHTLDDGSVTVRAKATDQAGNDSSAFSGSATKDTQAPAAPTSVAVVSPSNVINNSSKSNVSVDVVVPASSSASNTITVTLSDGTPAHTVTATSPSVTGGGTVHLTGIDASGLSDGSISLSATSTDPAGNPSTATSGSATKDTVAPSAPTSVAVVSPSNVINNSSKSNVSVDVVLPASSSSSDTINVSLSDAGNAHTVNASGSGISGGGTLHLTGIDASTLNDGAISLSATARDAAQNTSTATTGSATKDVTTPTVDAATIANTSGGPAGFLKQGNGYKVYANVSDNGGSMSTGTVAADVSNITSGQTAVALTFDSTGVTVEGTTYHWISGTLTAGNPLSEGSKSYTVTPTDVAGNSTNSPQSVTIDNTAPVVGTPVVAETSGGNPIGGPGFIKPSGTYKVYVNISDTAGVQSPATASVANIDATNTTINLTFDSVGVSVGGTTYHWISAEQNVKTSITNGAKSFSASATDKLGTGPTTTAGSVTVDSAAPNGLASKIAATSGGVPINAATPNFVRQGGTYRIYGNATDNTAGVGTVTGNVSNITSGQTAVAMTTCSSNCTIGGTTFAYVSAELTADNPLTPDGGTKTFNINATDNAGNSSSIGTAPTATVDNTAPTTSAGVIAATSGGTPINATTPGFVRQGGTYKIYANATDAAAGVNGATADASNLGNGSAVALTFNSTGVTVGGTVYHYISAELTAGNPLSEGSKSYTVTATDNAGNSSAPQSGSVTVDNTAPSTPTFTIPSFIKNGQVLSVSGLTDSSAGISNVTYYQCAGTSCTPTTSIGSSSTASSYSFTWSTQPADGDYRVLARATDNAGNTADSTTQSTFIENSLSATSLALTSNGDLKPGNGDSIAITFSNPVDESSICSGTTPGAGFTNIPVTASISSAGGNMTLSSTDPSCTTMNFGTIAIGYDPNPNTTALTETGNLSYDPSTKTLTLAITSTNATLTTNATAKNVKYTPDTGILGRSGVAIGTNAPQQSATW